MNCVFCKNKINIKSKFCPKCGNKIIHCEKCNTIFMGDKFCAECGAENSKIMYEIGYMFNIGKGVDQDYSLALEWFEKAAELDNSSAMLSLGHMYKNGEGMGQNYSLALEWFEKAAELDNTMAMINIGYMYVRGEGVTPDEYDPDEYGYEALKWFEKAAKLGNSNAVKDMYVIGVIYDKEGNYALADEYYQLAAYCGNSDAMLILGNMFWDEIYDASVSIAVGLHKEDMEIAIDWYQKAAALNNADAMYCLGVMYDKGKGVFQDYSLALEWYQKAAALGNTDAMYCLGVMYDKGKGVAQDYSLALEWYKKVAEDGDKRANNHIKRITTKLYFNT